MNILNAGISEEAYRNLYIGSEREMLWHCRSDPRFSYFACVPETIYDDPKPTYKIMSFVHGTGRTTEEYRKLFADFAASNNLILLFPLFPGGLFDQDDFNSYKLLSDQGIRYDLIFLSMIDDLAKRYPVDAEKILLYGWSGGGQFVHRFMYVHPERLQAVCIGAPGRITYLDDDADYYWGTRDFQKYFDKKPDIEAIRKVPIKLLIGAKDVKFVGDSPHGNNRMQRILELKENYSKHGIETQFETIPDFEHKGNDAVKAGIVMRFFQSVIDTEAR